MADLIDFSNIGKGIDTQMANAAQAGQQLGVNDATLPGRIQATNAGNAASVSNSGLQISNNQRQQAFQMESQALASNPNAQPADYQALANKYPEFAQQVNANQQQTQHNWENTRAQMSADAVSTVAGMQARLQANDVPGALQLLEARAVRQENSGDTQGAASTRSFEALINQNPEAAKQVASNILNAGSANTAEQLYGNQKSQAGAVVAQATVPATVAQANANASLTGTQAAYAPAQAAANIGATNAGAGLTQAQTAVTNQNLVLPPDVQANADKEYAQRDSNDQLATMSGQLANAFGEISNGTQRGYLGATWDAAQKKWTGDISAIQQLQREGASVVSQAEAASMVNGNFTDAATANAMKNVPSDTDNPQTWQKYFNARQQFLAAKSAWSEARGDWTRGNGRGGMGPATRDFTITLPNNQAVLVKSGDRFTNFSKQAAKSYFATPGAESFDPTK
jgi:hypothetical protein